MFTPINNAHAIVEAVVFVEFLPDLAASITSLRALEADLKSDLPTFDVQQMFKLEMKPQGQPSYEMVPAASFTLRHISPAGAPTWIVQVGPHAISVHCLDYTRWATVWPKCNKYLAHAFKALGASSVEVSAVGLKVVDRFLYDGDPNAYDAATLFDRRSTALPARAFTSGPRWHCHTGWFDRSDCGFGDRDVLNQLNIDSGMNLVEGRTQAIVTIDHTLTVRKALDGDLAQFAAPKEGVDTPLYQLVSHFHDCNKRALSDLLLPGMAKLIALNSEVSDVRS